MRFIRFFVASLALLQWPLHAQEPWMYPLEVERPVTRTDIDSLRISETYLEQGGRRMTEHFSREVDATSANFGDIAKWYANRWATPGLLKKLKDFEQRRRREPSLSLVHVDRAEVEWNARERSHPKPLITSFFCADHKQISTMLVEESGDTVSISIFNIGEKTRIVVMRTKPPKVQADSGS